MMDINYHIRQGNYLIDTTGLRIARNADAIILSSSYVMAAPAVHMLHQLQPTALSAVF